MKVTLNIPADEVSDLIDFLAESYNYTPNIYDANDGMTLIPNPESKNQFAKRMVMQPLKEGFDRWLIRKAINLSTVKSNVTIDSII